MLKGVYKEFITVKLGNNSIYEEALFVLRRTEKNHKTDKNNTELVFEANRILCEVGVKKPRKRFKTLKKVLFSSFFLLLGGFSGALITFLILN
jgi:hypothetical protein